MIGLIRSVSLGLAPDVSLFSVCGSVFVLSVQTSYEVSALFSFRGFETRDMHRGGK